MSLGKRLSMAWRYLKYIARHKYYVWVAGRQLGVSFWRLLTHDLSKLRPSEFISYCRYFYGEYPKLCTIPEGMHGLVLTEEEVLRAFNLAWLRHQHRNSHHWQHWVLREDSGKLLLLPMPLPAIKEMVADWAGAGRAITGRWEVWEWYQKNKDKMLLEQKTRWIAERYLCVWASKN